MPVSARLQHGRLTGRLFFLLAVAAPVVVVYGALVTLLSGADTPRLVLAITTTGIIAVALGLTITSVIPRELEGTPALIAVIGVRTSPSADTGAASLLPFYGSQRLVVAWNSSEGVATSVAHAAVATAVLLTLALAQWRGRQGLRRSLVPEAVSPV